MTFTIFAKFSEFGENPNVLWIRETLHVSQQKIPKSSGKIDISITVSGKVSVNLNGILRGTGRVRLIRSRLIRIST